MSTYAPTIHDGHPVTGAPGQYRFISGIGYIRLDAPKADVGQEANNETGDLQLRAEDPRSAAYANRNLGGPDHNIRRVFQTGTNGWLGGGDFLRKAEQGQGVGWGGFAQDSWDALRAAGGGAGGHPLIDTNPHDHAKILEQYANPDYNPFFWEHQRKGGATAGSVPDYLYNQLKNSVTGRRQVMQAYQSYGSGGGNVYGGNSELADRMMTEALYNEMGLGDILGEYTGDQRLASMTNNSGMSGMLGSAAGKLSGGISDGYQFQSKFSQPREKRQRQGVWGSGFTDGGYGMLSDETEVMRDAIVNQLEKKLLG
jgi:hypothetical protein